ncbi:MAG: nucleotidyltransferase family protein [Chloroflexi bacterium]|nr:nucleotidyltransferase family protein [Chloroflexota bacterium]
MNDDLRPEYNLRELLKGAVRGKYAQKRRAKRASKVSQARLVARALENARLRRKLRPILRQHDVVRAALFGSFARGEAGPHSDLDVLVEFSGEKSLLDLVALKLELEQKTQRKVDVLTYRSLHPVIRDTILSEQVAIL